MTNINYNTLIHNYNGDTNNLKKILVLDKMNIENISDIINDMDEFIQRNGIISNKILLRSKLRLLNHCTPLGKTKTVIRGLLIRMNRLHNIELTLRVMDILKAISDKTNIIKSNRKLTITRFVRPTDLVNWFSNDKYPIKQ